MVLTEAVSLQPDRTPSMEGDEVIRSIFHDIELFFGTVSDGIGTLYVTTRYKRLVALHSDGVAKSCG